MKKIQAVIFDVDGIILDTEPLHFESHRKALAEFGVKLDKQTYLDFGVVSGSDRLYEKISQQIGIKLDKEKIASRKKEIYRQLFYANPLAREGVLELIARLSSDFRLAIASSGSRRIIEFILNKFNLTEKFETIVCRDEVEKVKPFSDIYQKVLKNLKLKNSECVAIEDSQNGVIAAKEAGLFCLAVPCSFTLKQDFSRADRVLQKFKEINSNFMESL